MLEPIWQVKQVTYFPKSWKVYPTRKYQEKNDPQLYFDSEEGAKDLARILNADEKYYSTFKEN